VKREEGRKRKIVREREERRVNEKEGTGEKKEIERKTKTL